MKLYSLIAHPYKKKKSSTCENDIYIIINYHINFKKEKKPTKYIFFGIFKSKFNPLQISLLSCFQTQGNVGLKTGPYIY